MTNMKKTWFGFWAKHPRLADAVVLTLSVPYGIIYALVKTGWLFGLAFAGLFVYILGYSDMPMVAKLVVAMVGMSYIGAIFQLGWYRVVWKALRGK